ncbi:MAG: MaoC family dehydratase [Acidimicrobiia bacterium]
MTLHDAPLGRHFEDFVVGDVYRHPLGRTITEADNIWFTLLTMNTNPMHFDKRYAEQSEFGQALVASTLTVAIVAGQSVIDTSQMAFANLGWDEIRLTHPVFVGDTLYAESQVLELRDSQSRPHGGIVTIRTRGLNQNGVQVVSWKRTFFVYRQGAAGAKSPFPEPEQPW